MDTAASILRTLAYFDIFSYPLTPEEITRFMDQPSHGQPVRDVLDELTARGLVFKTGVFYSLRNSADMAAQRSMRNRTAQKRMPVAHSVGAWISRFPYVRAVGISGSLSKDCADEQSDIDFFIITAANHLWIARTLLHCLKKISFLFGKQHWFCMNYFIDECALEMTEKNVFVATELSTLRPVCGTAIRDLLNANEWAKEILPNAFGDTVALRPAPQPMVKRVIEKCFSNAVGDLLNEKLMNLTRKRWEKKERNQRTNRHGETMSLCVSKHTARPNPAKLQARIMEQFEERCRNIRQTHSAYGLFPPQRENIVIASISPGPVTAEPVFEPAKKAV